MDHVYATIVIGEPKVDDEGGYSFHTTAIAIANLFLKIYVPFKNIKVYSTNDQLPRNIDDKIFYQYHDKGYYVDAKTIIEKCFQILNYDEFNIKNDDPEGICYVFFIDHGNQFTFGEQKVPYPQILTKIYDKFNSKELIIVVECCSSGSIIQSEENIIKSGTILEEIDAEPIIKSVLFYFSKYCEEPDFFQFLEEFPLSVEGYKSASKALSYIKHKYESRLPCIEDVIEFMNDSAKETKNLLTFLRNNNKIDIQPILLWYELHNKSIELTEEEKDQVIYYASELFYNKDGTLTDKVKILKNASQNLNELIKNAHNFKYNEFIYPSLNPSSIHRTTIITSTSDDSFTETFIKKDTVPLQKMQKCGYLACGSPFSSLIIDELFFHKKEQIGISIDSILSKYPTSFGVILLISSHFWMSKTSGKSVIFG